MILSNPRIALTEIGLGGFSLVGIIELPPGCSTLFLGEARSNTLEERTPPEYKTPQADGLFAAARELMLPMRICNASKYQN